RMCSRPRRACSSARDMISVVSPVILMSIWMLVMPSLVPQTLKSMSPRWSSSPRMSERMAIYLLPLLHQAHGDASHRRLDGHTGVHEAQGATADRGHGATAVGFEDVGDD